MNNKFFPSSLAFVFGAAIMLAQGFDPSNENYLPPINTNVGSKYRVINTDFRIDSNKVLPISIGIGNWDMPRKISLHFIVSDEPDSPKPIQNGWTVQGKNPTAKVAMKADERRIFRTKIKINSDKCQHIKMNVLNENNEILTYRYFVINDPKYYDSAVWKYRVFDEKDLLVFGIPSARY
ncbi:MAG: hypothetical protein FWG02_01685 [Holophagaceae bacterium]|nr:hypothetical protein [Holophagaceae bacterium]